MENNRIIERLFSLQDLKYREFHSKLIPTIDKERVIGVRVPQLRKLAKELFGTDDADCFLHTFAHYYYEENNLHGFLIELIDNYDDCVKALDNFLPYIDNWATCDSISPKCFKKNRDKLYKQCKIWIADGKVYTVRFAVDMLMKHFLDDDFSGEYADTVCSIKSDEYYVKMVAAWYFATALSKHYEKIIPYFEQKRLDIWIHNKAIQKAIESYRITEEQKVYLKKIKRINSL